jgi:hypothetical protein
VHRAFPGCHEEERDAKSTESTGGEAMNVKRKCLCQWDTGGDCGEEIEYDDGKISPEQLPHPKAARYHWCGEGRRRDGGKTMNGFEHPDEGDDAMPDGRVDLIEQDNLRHEETLAGIRMRDRAWHGCCKGTPSNGGRAANDRHILLAEIDRLNMATQDRNILLEEIDRLNAALRFRTGR